MPAATEPAAVLQPRRDQQFELDRPAADRLVTNVNAPLRHQLLDATKTLAEASIEPDRAADEIRRKAVAL